MEEAQKKYPNLKGMLTISFGFFLVLFSFMSAVTVQQSISILFYSQLLRDKGHGNLGSYGVAILYLVFSMGCFVAPSIISMIRPQLALQLAASTYSIWIISGYFATADGISDGVVYFSVIFGSVMIGLGASVFWTTQGKYMSDCVLLCPEKSGLYTSLFFTIALGQQILAYLWNSIMLGHFDPSVLFIADALIGLSSLIVFGLLPNPVLPKGHKQDKLNARQSFNELILLFKDPRIIKMNGLFYNNSMAASFGNGPIIQFYCMILSNETLQDQLKISSLIMVLYGLGSLTGGLIIGFVNDRLGGSKAVSKANFILHALVYILLVSCNEIHQLNFLCYVTAYWIGTTDSMCNTQISILIANYFTQTAQPYAMASVVKAILISTFVYLSSFLQTLSDWRMYLIILGLSNLGCQLMVLFTFKFEKVVIKKQEKEGPGESEMQTKLVNQQ